MKWLILLVGIGSNASASILIKLAMSHGVGLLTLLKTPVLWLGLTLYGAAFVLYAVALRLFPLNVAHPVMTAGALLSVTAASALIFHEPLPPTTLVGMVLLGLGVFLIAMRAS